MSEPLLEFAQVTMSYPAGEAGLRTVLREVSFALAQGRSVIFDSPCLYDELLRTGMETASRYSDFR